MRFRVELQDFTVTRSALNQPLKNPTPVVLGTFWADISTLSGRELANAQQIKGNVTHKVTMRWVGIEIKPTYKFAFNGRTFQILWTDNVDQRNRTLLIYVVEEVAG
jgi:SPP1 family predicted phage head-tail adaptor